MHRRRPNATTGNSTHVRGFTSTNPLEGLLNPKAAVLNLKQMKKKATVEEKQRRLRARIGSGASSSKANLRHDSMGEDLDFGANHELQDFYQGNVSVDISHAGGELRDLESAAEEEVEKQTPMRNRRKKDTRTRRDRIRERVDLFQAQMPAAVRAYMEWAMRDGGMRENISLATADESGLDGSMLVRVVDVFRTYTYRVQFIPTDLNVLSAFIRQGLLPCAPTKPSVAITLRTIDLYHTFFMRTPRLTIQPFVKSLCDIHCVPFRSYLSKQFSICYDLFLSLQAETRALVDKALGRDLDNWRLQNVCPCCTYPVKGEAELPYAMLFTMDGGDSLKRVARREQGEHGRLGASKERLDGRDGGGSYILTREEVDAWSNGMMEDLLAATGEKEEDEPNPCAERWKNMKQEMSARMWGIFEETGVFLSLCRHGFVLVLCDMVRSDELAKYPLAVVNRLLDVLGEKLGGAYDIGCKFKTTLDKSSLGSKARELQFKTLVGLFHGHAHNRRCQLKNLLTYVKGVGIEDLEGCKRFFSRSNALATATRHASSFHRRQAIAEYCRYIDSFDTLQNLSDFLHGNYCQALDILDTEADWINSMRAFVGKHSATVEELKAVCEGWRKEEEEYLEGLTKIPEVETLQMEY
ncbi:hypothetical protein V5O48_009903, partial [Marasmius crinis-equi]